MKQQDRTSLVLETSNLTKYYGKARGIINVNLGIHSGEIFGFIGPNGAGKSTTIRLLLGLIFPSSGNGKIFGMDLSRESSAIKTRIGFMPSDVNYYPRLRAGELLFYSARFYGITDYTYTRELAENFDLDLSRKFRDLSLGNRKKVSIIQALLHKPDLLILDEPTSGLDPLMQKRFFDTITRENTRGATIFLSSHTLGDVQKVCGRVAIIKQGRIIKIEDVKSLRRKQLKKINLELTHTLEKRGLDLPGIHSLRENGRQAAFFYSGDINTLMNFLATKKIENITITEPELEDIFMHYYNKEETPA